MALKCAVDNWRRTYTLQRFFRTAVRQNDVTTVKGLITHQRDAIDLDAWNEDGISPIHQCCIDGNKKLMSLMVRGGADVNVADPKGWTSLHTSAAIGNYDLTKYLIRHGANIMTETMNGEIPIDLSFNVSIGLLLGMEMKSQGYVEEAEYYLNKIETYQKTQSLRRESRLTLEQEQYIEENDLVLCNSSRNDLLRIKSTLKSKLSRGKQRGNKQRTKSLLSSQALYFPTSRINSLPNYPMQEIEVTIYPTSILKKYDSYDSSSSSSSGQNSPTPSYSASSSSSSSSSSDSDGDSDGSEGSGIKYPVLKRQHSVQFDSGTLFMNYVQENEYTKLSNLLEVIEDISIIDTLDRKGLSAVHWATIKGYPECIEVLHRYGGDIDITDPFGWTALHAAVATNNASCVKKLLELNADLYALTKDGESVFDWTPKEEVLDILRNHIRGHIDASEVKCTCI